ncbi:hypothetical protein [Nocardiopsis sp. MG754419]|uniref:hypothetical protein n=1 Tax=Nocardiopsis sp. MG754419 TaxID=2259865 RepID=UPI001BA817D3|nr:hypothetical protein [Nocardiopsis sp. MG754419]MBR8741978.1 hypothetical protein [Nocardiopsis sp. MG754419]
MKSRKAVRWVHLIAPVCFMVSMLIFLRPAIHADHLMSIIVSSAVFLANGGYLFWLAHALYRQRRHVPAAPEEP